MIGWRIMKHLHVLLLLGKDISCSGHPLDQWKYDGLVQITKADHSVVVALQFSWDGTIVCCPLHHCLLAGQKPFVRKRGDPLTLVRNAVTTTLLIAPTALSVVAMRVA